ncbi:MAG: hypothetical protein ACJAT0_000965 [Nonlabens sp.]|uniref:hypothetical protein n=1 Tax=Nonlabens sp. TaxID=1888209 RepID=UPI0039E2D9BE
MVYVGFPHGNRATDGVVMGYNYFGRTISVSTPLNGRRTTTYEIFSFLVCSIFGVMDVVLIILSQTRQNLMRLMVTASLDAVSCGTTDMVQHHRDSSDDSCMNLFKVGQEALMRANL